MSTKLSSHHIAIDSQGYILAGSPTQPGRTMQRNTVFGNRFASGDRDYTDLSFWWYWAQTDWSGGIKNNRAWEDDAKFWWSTNIDTFSNPGSFQLPYHMALAIAPADITYGVTDLTAGTNCSVAGTATSFVGTDDGSVIGKAAVFKFTALSSYTEIAGSDFGGSNNQVNQILGHKENAWILTGGAANTWAISYYDGSSMNDVTANAITAVTGSDFKMPHAGCELGGDLYIGGNDAGDASYVFIVKTSDSGANFSSIVELDSDAKVSDIIGYKGDLYYLLFSDGTFTLKKYDIANTADTTLYSFKNVSPRLTQLGGRLLFESAGNLVITVPHSVGGEVWFYNGSDLWRAYYDSEEKKNLSEQTEATSYLREGGAVKDGIIYWGNLVFDGTSFHNYIKGVNDDAGVDPFVPMFVTADNIFYWHGEASGSFKRAYYEADGTYKSSDNENFIVFCEDQNVSTIKKLAHSATIIFEKLEANEEIIIQYSTDGGATYTELGTADYANDGDSVTQKTFNFGDDVVYNKIIYKVFLNSDGTSTPVFKDISTQFLPIPDYQYRWNLRLDCTDGFLLLNDKSKDIKKGEDLRHSLRTSFMKKELVEFEDIDYAETKINDAEPEKTDTTITVDSTDGFPEQGRLRIEDEEILYTGKTRTTFTGCTRGYRGTNAADHADNDVVSNKYKVLITDYKESIPLANEAKVGEFIIDIELIEA